MKLSLHWLREWVDAPLTDAALAEQLTLAGLEVESIDRAAPPLTEVIAARLVEIAPHPEQETLAICHLDIGKTEHVQAVCGEPGLSPGRCYPYAPSGTTLPSGRHVTETVCHGVPSAGMLCTYDELGLVNGGGEKLPYLTEDTVPGQDIAALLELDDHILDLSLTPDRGDCLGLRGLAREVAALNALPYRQRQIPEVPAAITACQQVSVSRNADCPRYVGRVLRGVNAAAPTPAWMVERLRRGGQRSVNVLVDITNYIMLELGQPMHVFDLGRIAGPITVRRAKRKESIRLLNAETVELATDCLLIADSDGPLALAGIMGGERAAVTSTTRDVFFESALFMPRSIRGRAWRYGLHTESSMRFERGVEPAMQRLAMERATALALDICDGQPGPVVETCTPMRLPRPRPVHLRRRWLEETLGVHIPVADVQAYLKRLEFQVETTASGWRVTPPGHRYDITMEADLAAEIVRLYGYERLPAVVPTLPLALETLTERAQGSPVYRLRQHLLEHGYVEAVTYSFVDPVLARLFSEDNFASELANPLSEQAAVMRLSLWPGLLGVLRYNYHRQQERVRAFEQGAVYRPTGEELCLGGVVLGPPWEEQWGTAARPTDFYDVKRDLEAWLPTGSRWQSVTVPGLHPGQSAEILFSGNRLGLLGRLHPAVARQLDLPAPWLFEIYPGRFPVSHVEHCEPPPRFPSARRDLAMVVDQSITAQNMIEAIRDKYKHLIAKAVVFDVFHGENLGKNQKSYAIGLIFQRKSSTLADKDIDSAVAEIQLMLKERFNAELRSRGNERSSRSA